MAQPKESMSRIDDFRLPASTGQTLGLDSFKGKVPMVLVFLDLEVQEDRALLMECNVRLKDFGELRSQILAVARVTAREAREVAEEMGLAIPLLADASGAMARDYEATGNTSTRRIAIVADKEGRLIRRFDPLEDDAAAVVDGLLYSVRAIGGGSLKR